MKVINVIKLIIDMEDFFMRKKSKLSELTKELMKDKEITDVLVLQSMLKEMLKNGLQE